MGDLVQKFWCARSSISRVERFKGFRFINDLIKVVFDRALRSIFSELERDRSQHLDLAYSPLLLLILLTFNLRSFSICLLQRRDWEGLNLETHQSNLKI